MYENNHPAAEKESACLEWEKECKYMNGETQKCIKNIYKPQLPAHGAQQKTQRKDTIIIWIH